jgi:hypothetical protein
MEFIKKNYEKIILSLVLLGLAGVLAFMPVMIYSDQQKMKDLQVLIIPRKVEPLPPLDLARYQGVLDRLKSPYNLDLSTTNKLFNPVDWLRVSDGRLVKAGGTGPQFANVTKITPLYFSISLDSVMTNTLGKPPRYAFSVADETAALPVQRRARHQYASKGETVTDKSLGKNEGFTLVEVKGLPENPDELDLKLADSGETVPVSKGKPYRRPDAYSADLKYADELTKERYTGTGLRVGDTLSFAGDTYNVIAIGKNEMVLLAQSNQKHYTLTYKP